MGGKRKARPETSASEVHKSADDDEDPFGRDDSGLSLYERQRLELYVAITATSRIFC